MIAVNSENFYYSCYSNLSPCFFGLGYCRNSNLLIVGTVDSAEGRPHREVIEMMALGFTGKLQQWWNNCLTEVSKEDIKYAIQKDENIHEIEL